MKVQYPEKDRSERWMLTYSDLMNLLLILFIVLYCMSRVDASRAMQVAMAIKQGFHSVQTSSVSAANAESTIVNNGASGGGSSSGLNSYEKLYQDIMRLIEQRGLTGEISVSVSARGVVITLNNAVLFASGSADLSQSSTNLIISLGNMLKNVSYSQLVVQGFTDSDPIHTAQFKDNRDLSSERANNVARILQYQCGIAPDKISSLGYGEYQPVAPNTTTANKEKNRRVVISVVRDGNATDAVLSAQDLVKQQSAASGASAANEP